MKKVLFIALALLVSMSFAAKKVKSKLGDIELTKEKGGGSVVCTAGFNDEMTIVKEADTDVLVKGSCGQGWVPKSKIEYVAQLAGDKSMTLDDQDIVGWLDNPSAVFVLENDDVDFDGVNIDRDFKEYLQHTMDREQTEMRNNEN
ncbi:MAG: hypothetical protein MJY87_10850 [Fibrobacter sp.]|nr:hypothetical protein [Fibrobacter sp.]